MVGATDPGGGYVFGDNLTELYIFIASKVILSPIVPSYSDIICESTSHLRKEGNRSVLLNHPGALAR